MHLTHPAVTLSDLVTQVSSHWLPGAFEFLGPTMTKILPSDLSTADNATPAENVELQKLIERAEDAANKLEGIGNSVRLLELERQHEACIPEPFVRFKATIKLSSVYAFAGTEQELRDAVVDELCAMFNLKRR